MNKMIRALILFLCLIVTTTYFYKPVAHASGVETAYFTTLSGEVSVTRAGGAKSIPAFINMKLFKGDQIITGDSGSATIKVTQLGAEKTLGRNTNAVISNVKPSASGNIFSIKLWAGSMWSSGKTVTGAFEDIVETPGSKLSTRDANFLVVIQPDNTLSVFVASGLVTATINNSPSSGSSIIVAPTQQLSVNPSALPQQLQNALSVVDVPELVGLLDSSVLKAIIISAPAISLKNNEFMILMQNSLDKKVQPVIQQDGVQSDISIKTQEGLNTYSQNINYLISNIASESVNLAKIDLSKVNQLINTVNNQIADPKHAIRLQAIESLNPLAGVDPSTVQEKVKEHSRLTALRKDVEQKQLLLQSNFKAQLSESMKQILAKKQILDSANKSILEQLKNQAERLYTDQLSSDELAIFQRNKQILVTGYSDTTTVPVTSVSNNPSSPVITPEVTLVQTKTAQGFDLSIHLKNFTGTNALYGAEFHFISDDSVEVIGSDNRFLNNSFFSPANSVDIIKTIFGTTGNSTSMKKETIYAVTQFGTASNKAISDGVLATIPFSVSSSGTLELLYVKIVDNTGRTVLELTNTKNGLPPVLTYTK